uniref:F-box/LRR-repeat protein At3g48880-like n=2 Tax=Elaeis guineensis var. tenera TaxID=51953 RepID=A0A6I9S7V5_ELAGV|nr:F-box/LRR-repeat protein At3g48880-like [Elaeis guineensis]
MSSFGDPDVLVEMGKKCKNFSQLKVMGSIDMRFDSKIAGARKLKVLSLRCCVVTKEALLLILYDMAHLEVLNIAHCLIIDGPEPQVSARPPAQIIKKLDQMILEKASRLRAFFHSKDYDTCIACKWVIDDVGIMRWYWYKDWFWRQDEVSVLDLGYHGNLFDEHCASKGFEV